MVFKISNQSTYDPQNQSYKMYLKSKYCLPNLIRIIDYAKYIAS